MPKNDAAVMFVVMLFLFLASFPFVVIVALHSGILPSIKLSVGLEGLALAAIVPLLAIPVVAVAVLLTVAVFRRIPRHVRKPGFYHWEKGVFAPEREALPEPVRPVNNIGVSSNPRLNRFSVAAIIIVLLAAAALLVLFTPAVRERLAGFDFGFAGKNATSEVVKPAVPSANVEGEAGASHVNLTGFFIGVKNVAYWPVGAVRALGGGIRKAIAGVYSSVTHKVKGVPPEAWRIAVIGIVVLLAGAAFFNSYRSGQLFGLRGWVSDIAAAIWRNRFRVALLMVAAAVVASAIAVFIFRKRLLSWFGGFGAGPAGVVSSVRDFVSAYRLYLLIGIFALLAVIALLFVLEKKGQGKG
ncbi:TPA: hypothetical protein HA231_03760 [Candidatus Woesearchaeota archaeon]|nr:hypothetical protein [Candidatus Woesearchaeota archaeon]